MPPRGGSPPRSQTNMSDIDGAWELLGGSRLFRDDGSESDRESARSRSGAGTPFFTPAGGAPPPGGTGGVNLPEALSDSQAGQILAALDSIADTLREGNLLSEVGFSFPEIAVVGQESTGKSSVLERVLGLPLFPRGADICTRLAIRLRLSHLDAEGLRAFCEAEKLRADEDGFYIRVTLVDADTGAIKERTPFEGPVRANDFSVQGDGPTARINALMKRQVAGDGGISLGVDEKNVLQLDVKSRRLSDLNLLDLPGVVGGAVEGEPTDMDERTRRLVARYLGVPDTLVLIVAEATASSVRNSSAFALVANAGKVDRALGVLTKADGCIGPSLNRLKERLLGRAKDLPPLAYGYVGLVNRDTADARNLSIAQAADEEASWLRHYMPELADANGGDVLVQKLAAMLVSYVKDTWSDRALTMLRAERTRRGLLLRELGFRVKEDDAARQRALTKVVEPIPAWLRSLGSDEFCTTLNKFVDTSLEVDLSDHHFGPHDVVNRLTWASRWNAMLVAIEINAEVCIENLTSRDKLDAGPGEWESLILRKILKTLEDNSQKPPLRAVRFSYLYSEVLELAADVLEAARPELLAKAVAHLRALNTMSMPFLPPGRTNNICANALDLLTPGNPSLFQVHVLKPLAMAMTFDVLVVTATLLESTFSSANGIVRALLKRKAGLGLLMQEDAESAALRAKLSAALAGLKDAMVSIAEVVGKPLLPDDEKDDDELEEGENSN